MKNFGIITILSFVILALTSCSVSKHSKEDHVKFGMQVVLTSVTGKGSELAKIMLRASQLMKTMEGCELYLVQQSILDENQILITELWSDKENHQASLANEEVRKLINQAKPLITEMDGKPAKLIGGHGIN